jgi:hypothetical protein
VHAREHAEPREALEERHWREHQLGRAIGAWVGEVVDELRWTNA